MVSRHILVDSNVLLDIVLEDKNWFSWSSDKLLELSDTAVFIINPIIYAEVSISFKKIENLEYALPDTYFRREGVPWEAAFLAGKCFLKYRRSGGVKQSTLPDFFIGAHAAVQDYELISRDTSRYKSYFPTVTLHSP